MRSRYDNFVRELRAFVADLDPTHIDVSVDFDTTFDPDKDPVYVTFAGKWSDFPFDLFDREYYRSYGCQNAFGTIWFSDGSWAVREEYDGSEWWEHRVRPPLP